MHKEVPQQRLTATGPPYFIVVTAPYFGWCGLGEEFFETKTGQSKLKTEEIKMRKSIRTIILGSVLTLAASTAALATPSTQIWIPSTDIQTYKTLHLGIDNYVRTSSNLGNANYYDIGLTAGVLPFEKIQAEIGIDYLDGGQGSVYDKSPIYFNAKIGTPVHVTERLLNHVSGTISGVAAVYNRYNYAEEMSSATDRYEEVVDRLVHQNRSENSGK